MTSSEPIAIVGMACRFAGDVDSPDRFWALLRDGRDTVGEIPDDRWSWYAGQSPEHAEAVAGATRRGSFLTDIAGFDADFFEITPREAALMDPQQRIVLELAWEALEHAGIPPRGLAGSDAGVFMGVGTDDYGRRLLEDLPRVEAWTGIGGAYCAVANRVSYVLDLHGPSMTVDTACSSSLVAIHLAAQALRAGECDLALAGGVLVMAAPGLTLVLDAAGATAPDGRCKSFDAAADGYGRGEGGGVVVLKRLDDARRDNDRILAVVRGSAVRQDGRTNGIMAPNGPAQAELMRRACRDAGIDPRTVDYVEAHGTGTPVGDPLEAGALASVFGAGRPADRPLLIGSVKPNIGHLEAGAGVAGVIKTVLALGHGELPPSLRVAHPNPAIDWESAGLRVVTEVTRWPREDDAPRRAAVSGYGYGGTIAHLVIDGPEPPVDRDREPERAGPRLYPLSGAAPAALRQYADRLADRLATEPGPDLTDVGHTLARRRGHLPHRCAVVADGRADLVQRLRAYAETGRGGVSGVTPSGGERGVVWVFSGHGSHWTGMGRDLIADTPAFAEVFDRLDPVFRAELGLSPQAVLFDDRPQPVDVIQPMIFAVQVALAATWQSLGLRPAAVIGHSVGEIAAAVTAGILTLEQGARLVCRRSLLLRQVAGAGAMAMVDVDADEAARRLAGRDDVVVAITASPGWSVLSGDATAVAALTARWRDDGVRVLAVNSDVAFHSPHMDPLLDALRAATADLPPTEARIPVYTTALADPRSAAPRDGAYWATNLRGTVRFAQAVTAAAEDGHRLFLEVSAHPVVAHSVSATLDSLPVGDARVAYSLRRGQPGREVLLTNLGELHCHGAAVDWSALWPDGDVVDLPTVAWQRRRHWAAEPPAPAAVAKRHDRAAHTLLGGRTVVRGAAPADVWSTRLDRGSRPYPGEHPVRGVEIIPAAVLLNTFLAAASTGRGWVDLADVALRVPVSVTRPREVQVVRQGETLRLSSRILDAAGDEDEGWVTHTAATADTHAGLPARADVPTEVTEPLGEGFVVDRLGALGVAAMGFPWAVRRLGRTADGLVADVDTGDGDATVRGWAAVLDAALSIASVVFPGPAVLRMPAHIERVTLSPAAPNRARIAVRRRSGDVVDVEIVNSYGEVAGRLTGLRYGRLDLDVEHLGDAAGLVHEIAWRPGPQPAGRAPDAVVLVGPVTALGDGLAARLDRLGVPCRHVSDPRDLTDGELTDGHAILVVPADAHAGDLAAAVAANAWLLARTARRLAAVRSARPARLWCVTQGVLACADRDTLGHAALWGLGRIVGGERPEIWGGVVDVGAAPADLSTLVALVAAGHGEDVVAVRDGEVLVPRLRAAADGPDAPSPLCRPDGTYLITGGLGALGLEVASWLASRGARRIVLAGRRGLPDREAWDRVTDPGQRAAVEAVRALERAGVTVAVVALDVADPDQAARLLRPAALGLPPVRGIVHAAGVLDDRTVDALDEESLRRVLRPKVTGALTLHTLFPPGSTDFFVLFSSAGQLLGLPGQASYAAGNAFLDGLARHRRAAGDGGARSILWTSWRGLGMSTSAAVIDAELAARGTADVSAAEAFSSWERVQRHDLGEAVVLRVLPESAGGRRPPLLSELPTGAGADPAPEAAAPSWAGLDGAALHAHLRQRISEQVADETRLPATEVDPHRPLSEMGLDSVMTTRIRSALEREFQLALPATLLWDQPTVGAIAEYVATRLKTTGTEGAE
ncbi:type I polyketide synthase [Micromonospora narathiwatensis]|uniref:6-methylsalicylic acid synthase n=1 Tax=Micromonospora narathiwatensis TaxID=299146 RepID=A0A1A8ZSJ3_9ACTN|nr:type I polyketide synthase [Micromonospora narathiwatensis]SBT46860.1 6-methylsalicylic acid synthase [Micromonospora narathiwatensis]